MRIAIVTEVWQPSVNGVVTRLAATVSHLVNAGHEVLVIAPAVVKGDAASFPGAQVRLVPTLRFGFLYGGQTWGLPLPRVGRWLAEFKPDVLHVVNPVLLGMAGVAAARRQRLTLVCSYHTDVACYAGFYRLGWLRPALRGVQRRMHGRAMLNLVTSETGADQLRRLRPTADGENRIAMWRRGVDLDGFRPGPKPDASPEKATLLYVGRIAAEKDLATLAPVAHTEGLRLVLVGDGPGRRELADRLSDTDATFTGNLHGAELAQAYAAADVFVFPSTTETLGLVLLEALAAGLPVVAADSPASREVLGDCPAARLYTAGEADRIPALVNELLTTPREVLTRQARAHVAGYSWSAATDQLVGYYREAQERYASSPNRDRLHRQVGRFGVVGGLNALVDIGVFNILLAIAPTQDPGRLAAFNTVAVLAAIANSYWWNSRWTFRHRAAGKGRRARIKQRMLFIVQAGLNIAVNNGVLVLLSVLLAGQMAPSLANNISKVVAMLAATLVSFLAMRFVVFRHPRHTSDSATDQSDRTDQSGRTQRPSSPASRDR